MFAQQELEKYADLLLWGVQKARVEPYMAGDVILIRFDLEALPLAETLHTKCLDRGFHPVLRLTPTPKMELDFFSLGNDDQLTFLPEWDRELFAGVHGSISLLAPASLTHLSVVNAKRIGMALVARKPLREIWEKRESQGAFGWSLCLWPTLELAKHAGLSVDDYKQEIVSACYLNAANPVAEWERIFNDATAIKDGLNSLPVRQIHVESAQCDLLVNLGEQRRWLGISGHNMPSFEIFTSPDWRGATGHFFADQPSFRSGNLVRGVKLEFKDGRVVSATAEEGERFVQEQVAMDDGAAQLGEFSLTDRRFSKINRFMAHTLFDENFGGPFGNCHVALGASYGDTYRGDPKDLDRGLKDELGFNDSALHWDLVNTEDKRVTAILATGERQVIYEGGEFRI